MAEPATPPSLSPEAGRRLVEFARACKGAIRAVSLYPVGHPAITSSLSRLSEATARLSDGGPSRLLVRDRTLQLAGAVSPRADPAIVELADLLYRHLIGGLTINVGADADSWRALLLLLGRAPEEVRADGGIGHLWATAGGPSLEIEEIDYAEVLREKQGLAATIDQILAAAMAGPVLQVDDAAMRALLEIVGDPGKLDELMAALEGAAPGQVDKKVAVFLSLLRGVVEHTARTNPERLDAVYEQMGKAAGRLSADAMVALLEHRDRPDATSSTVDVVSAMARRMTDRSVAEFVAGSVIAERGATERLAHAFQALAPEMDRQRKLIALAEEEVAASPLAQEEAFSELWKGVEGMLTSYSDADFVSTAYGRELSNARARAVSVEQTSDDPPDRLAAWLSTVNDTALHTLDHQLLLDLLLIEADPLRWRDIAETVVTHGDALLRVGSFDRAWQLVERVVEQSAARPDRQPHAAAALEQFGRGSMMKHAAPHLRSAADEGYERFARICHAMGPAVIPPLAEALSSEQDARARRRLRDILLGFGARGRESVQQLMSASNWEVRRTAAYLLREFGGSEGLKDLAPLLADPEPLVQREAVQGLVLNGSDEAARMLLDALARSTGRSREALVTALVTTRDERAAPFFGYLLPRIDRRGMQQVYLGVVEALGTFGGDAAVAPLITALRAGEWWAPQRTRRLRAAAAGALRKLGTPAAIDALRAASSHGPIGARSAARAELQLLKE